MASRSVRVEIIGDPSSLKRAFGDAGRSASGFGSLLGKTAKTGAVVLGGLAVAGGGALVKMGFGFNQMREQSKIAFTTMLGDGQKAERFLDDLQSFAARTPFEFAGLAKTSQQLLAMGFQAKQVIPTMTAIGDAVAGLGGSQETLEQVTRALGQIQAKGKTSAEEMLQLTEAGVPAWQMLADKIGKSVPEAMKLVSQGAIDSKTTIDAVTTGMERRFGGMMEKQSHTFQGLLSTLSDTAQQVAGAIMGPLFGKVEAGLQGIVDRLPDLQAAVSRFMEAKGFRAKLNIVWGGVREAAAGIAAQVGAALGAVDWSAVGSAIGAGLTLAVDEALTGAKALTGKFMDVFRGIDWVEVGRIVGPGLAAAVAAGFATLLDPGFWLHNWDLALAIGTVAFGGAVGKIAGSLAGPLVRVFGDAVIAVAAEIERLSPRLAAAFLSGALRIPGLLRGVFGEVESLVAGTFGRLGRLAVFTVKVLGVEAVINSLVGLAHRVAGLAGRFAAEAKEIGRAIVEGVVSGIGSLAGAIASKLESAVGGALSHVKGIFGIHSPSTVTRDTIGVPLAEGVMAGFASRSGAISGLITDTVSDAIQKGKVALDKGLADLIARPLKTSPHGGGEVALASANGPSLSGAIALVGGTGRQRDMKQIFRGGVIGMADGGVGRALGPTLFYSAGNEDFAFSGEGSSFSRARGGGGPDGDLVLMVDGEVIGRIARRALSGHGSRNATVFSGGAIHPVTV